MMRFMPMHLTLARSLAVAVGLYLLSSCDTRRNRDEATYLTVIGEYEQPMPDAGYRLNLSFNGPLRQRGAIKRWADSLQQQVPSMVLTSENVYMNYMPEQAAKLQPELLQANISYNIIAADSAMYTRIMDDLLRRKILFSLQVGGTVVDHEERQRIQQELMQKALQNATQKLNALAGSEDSYEIVEVEEMDNTVPYGPEYNDFNRCMVSRVRVKARKH
ncbi:hypothetical protein MKJ04_06905 [Pontibacter sp. E15-1]|uniref:hypothetical protein n=1 Tax=Pontibacter sp. E15-1 TaxID=2919918 RepID=UPI001F4F6D58|nr:hypothetical protein [Pontibacter sp. E15-1]MCJ8164571.1 hypothetical protein [Pontibacter sp. E15-1]